METSFLILSVLLTVVITILFSVCLIRRYTDPRDSSCLTTTASALSISCTLLAILLIPVDIWTVSSALNADGTQIDPILVEETGAAIRGLYYTMYITMCTLCFLILPFAYFYYEEDNPELSFGAKASAACKYTCIFVILFVVLLSLGLILKSDRGEEDSLINELAGDFGDGDAVLFFCIGTLAALGMTGWVIYAAYGMGVFPASLFRDFDNEDNKSEGGEGGDDKYDPLIEKSKEDLDIEIYKIMEKLKYLTSKYDMTGNKMSKKDKTEYTRLRRELRRVRALKKRKQEASTKPADSKTRLTGSANGPASSELSCCDKCWNCMKPLRVFFGGFAWIMSLLVWVSLMLSSLDKYLNSECGAECGYAILRPSIVNPLDSVLNFFSQFFPVDLIIFTFIVLFVFICCVYGLIVLGVRFFCISLYPIQVKATPPNGMLMASWYLAFILLVFNLQVLTLAPQYVAYGTQFYTDASNPNVTLSSSSSSMPIYSSSSSGFISTSSEVFESSSDFSSSSSEVVSSSSSVAADTSSVAADTSSDLLQGFHAEPMTMRRLLADLEDDHVVEYECDINHVSKDGSLCVQTQIAEIINALNTNYPFFGVVNFYGNVLFLLMFVGFQVFGIYKCTQKRKNGYKALGNNSKL